MSKEDPTGKVPNGAPADDEGYAPGRDPLVQGGGTCAVNCGGSGGGHSAGSAGGVASTQQKSVQVAQAGTVAAGGVGQVLSDAGPGLLKGAALGNPITGGILGALIPVFPPIPAGECAAAVCSTSESAQGTTDGTQASDKKAVPNPDGRKGEEAHQGTVGDRAQELEDKGHTITAGGGKLPERGVRTEAGKLRFPDISTIGPNGEPYYENVGRSRANGSPIAREQRALDDIGAATGTTPGYTPYDQK